MGTKLRSDLIPRRHNTFASRLLGWFAENGRILPWRTRTNAYEILIAEVLLQRTPAAKVAPMFEDFLQRWPTAHDLATSRPHEVATIIRPLGLATKRSSQLRSMAQAIVRECEGEVPSDLDSLQNLPGVGDYTSKAVLTFAHGKDFVLLDGVTARVYRRLAGIEESWNAPISAAVREAASALAPTREVRDYNWAMLDLASLVCRPQVPRCSVCPVRLDCSTWRKLAPV